MNDLTRTIIAVVAAAGLAGAAYISRPAPVTDAGFSDQGEVFFPSFTDALQARSLQVLSYDDAAATIRPFRVEFDGARWVIPSHHNYPADAQRNMAQASSVFIGLTKEQVVSDRAADHEALGVLAPDDAAAPLRGRGTRITIRGEGGALLADMIVGREVENDLSSAPETGSRRRYVRLPDRNRVYAVNFLGTFSTAFTDWVETDLLRLERSRIDRLVVDRYRIDEQRGVKQPVERLRLARLAPPDPFGPAQPGAWAVESEPGGGPGDGESVNTERIEQALSALRDLRIVGVRPKPQRLAEWFAGDSQAVTQMDVLDLQSRGFFVTAQGQFVANEGELIAACDDGVVYTIYFGEILFGRGEDLTAGRDTIGAAAEEETPREQVKGQEARYIFINATFDESLIPMPEPPDGGALPAPGGAERDDQPQPYPQDDPRPGADETDRPEPGAPEAAAAPEHGEAPGADANPGADDRAAEPSPAPAEPSPAMREYERKLEERSAKVEAGRRRAEALSRRFAPWYYVIDAGAFGTLRPLRVEVVTPAGESGAGVFPDPDAQSFGPAGPGAE